MAQNRSRSSGNRGHVPPERPVTFLRNSRSRSTGIGGHVAPEYSPQQNTVIVPCRSGRVVGTEVVGDFCVLDFELGSFSLARDVEVFNRELQGAAANLAHWKDGRLVGYFCCQLSSIPGSLKVSTDPSDWQALVTVLKSHNDFKSEPFFYFISGVYLAGATNTKSLEAKNGTWTLKASRSYEVRMLQFSPGETHSTNASPETNWIIGDADGVAVTFVTTRKLAVDSGYDIKHIRFRTTSATSRIHSMLSFFRKFSKVHLPADGGIWDFDLPLVLLC